MNGAARDSWNSCEHNEASQDAGGECSSEWWGQVPNLSGFYLS